MHIRSPHDSPAKPSPAITGGTAHPEQLARWKPTGPEQRFHWLMLLLALAVLSLAAVLHVRDGSQVLLPIWNVPLPSLCTFRRVFGIDCPGCGLTRSFISLIGGDVGSAWRYNAAGIFFFLLLVFQIPYRVVQLWRSWRGRPEFQLHSLGFSWLMLLCVALVAQWLFKLF